MKTGLWWMTVLAACATPASHTPGPATPPARWVLAVVVPEDSVRAQGGPIGGVAFELWTPGAVVGEHWSLVDGTGWLGDVQIASIDSDRSCDHCATHLVWAQPIGTLARRPDAHTFALGPASTDLTRARVTAHHPDWIREWSSVTAQGRWVEEVALDLDGDAAPDLIRYAKGAQIEHEVRVRHGNAWVVTQHWVEPVVLDVADACAPFPRECYRLDDPDDDDGCPEPAPLDVTFAAGATRLPADYAATRQQVLDALPHLDAGARFDLVGDRAADEPEAAAHERAQLVHDDLVQHGVPAQRLHVTGAADAAAHQAAVLIRIVDCVAGQ